jgi:hypothetical protein
MCKEMPIILVNIIIRKNGGEAQGVADQINTVFSNWQKPDLSWVV